MDEKILRTLRAQAWERAKGELQAMMQTYWDDHGKYQNMDKVIRLLVETVEGNGLQE